MKSKYVVWTGTKFKGCWDDAGGAVRYMASRAPESRGWVIVDVDINKNVNANTGKSVTSKLKGAIANALANLLWGRNDLGR